MVHVWDAVALVKGVEAVVVHVVRSAAVAAPTHTTKCLGGHVFCMPSINLFKN